MFTGRPPKSAVVTAARTRAAPASARPPTPEAAARSPRRESANVVAKLEFWSDMANPLSSDGAITRHFAANCSVLVAQEYHPGARDEIEKLRPIPPPRQLAGPLPPAPPFRRLSSRSEASRSGDPRHCGFPPAYLLPITAKP